MATYADATVICGEVARDPQSPTHVINPAVVVEVLSPSSEEYDRGDKRLHYQRLDSLREYVLIAQDRRRIEVFARKTASEWSHRVYGAGESITLESIDCPLDVDELYASADVAVT